ncbi:MAG: DUF2752 domain-containing protein [Elusimicrobiota bacterium]|nr:DUF2752 domain-containing protein [Elusimicrobiota bacterium]
MLHIPTPTCGLTRAWISFFKQDISTAFAYHPLFLLAPILFFTIFNFNKNKIYKICSFIIVGIFFAVYIARLFYGMIL